MVTTAPDLLRRTLRRPRMLLAATAVAALLLSGCGAASDDAAAPGTTRAADPSPEATSPPDPSQIDGTPDVPVAVGQEATFDPVTDEVGGFPLAAGWPSDADAETEEGGLTLPIEQFLADFADYTCGRPAPSPRATSRLRAQFSNVEDYRTRELVVLANADAAVAWVGELQDFYASCPLQREYGLTYPVAVLDTAVGGQSFGVLRSTEWEGQAAIGLSALQVVRVGRAVLLDHTSGEGSAAARSGVDGAPVLDAMTSDSTAVVAAMCDFAAAGC